MSKQIIAVDVDEVLVETATAVIDFYNRKYGTKVLLEDYYSPNLTDVWNAPDRDTVIRRVNGYLDTEEYRESQPVQDAMDVLRNLKAKHELHIVTGRPDFTEEVTLQWLKKYFPDIFKTVVFTNFFQHSQHSSRTKSDVCLELKATILIDDHLQHALEVAGQGVTVLLFGNYPWNRVETLPPNIIRVESWKAVGEYFG